MRTSVLKLALLGALVAQGALAAPLGAQDVQTVSGTPAPALRGTLRDSLGFPMVRVEVSHGKTATMTDGDGNFRLTPVPTGRFSVRFARDGKRLGELEVNVTADTLPGVQVEVLGNREERRTLLGVVVDSAGTPMRNVTVDVVTAMKETRTDSLGRFTVRQLPAMRHFLRIRRVGYAPTFVAVDLTDSVPRRARIVLKQYAGQNLGLVVVRANRPSGRMQAFLNRAERKSGWGRIFTEADIASRNPMRASDMFQGVAGVRVNQDRFGRGLITGRGGCVMALFINGFPTPQMSGSGIDDMLNTLDLAGIEIYNGIAGVPMDLTMGPPNSCGTIGAWTK